MHPFNVLTEHDNNHSHHNGPTHSNGTAWPRFSPATQGIQIKYPGDSPPNQILFKADNSATYITNNSEYTNGVMDIESYELYLKYESNQVAYIIEGPNFDSKIIYNGVVNDVNGDHAYPPIINTTSGKQAENTITGIQPWAYSGQNGRNGAFDYFNFSDFVTRIHEDDPGNRLGLAPPHPDILYAGNPHEARYKDGDYIVSAELMDVRGNYYTREVPIRLDNFMPFVKQVVFSVPSATLYSQEWASISNTCIQLTQHNSLTTIEDDLLILTGNLTCITSEPIQDFTVNIPTLGINHLSPNSQVLSDGFFKYTFLINFSIVGVGSNGYVVRFEFEGHDRSGNALIAFNDNHIGSCWKVPKRITVSMWSNPDGLTQGQDNIHKFVLNCSHGLQANQSMPGETTVNVISDDLDVDTWVAQSNSCHGSTIYTYVQGGIGPYTYSWSHDPNFHGKNAENLEPGTYCVTITDPLCGYFSKCITITNDLPRFGIIDFGNTSHCISTPEEPIYTCDGYINVDDNIFPPPNPNTLTFSWTGPNNFTSSAQNINHLCPGDYSLTITTASGCVSYLSRNICCCSSNVPGHDPNECNFSFPEQLQISADIEGCSSLYQNDGAINLTIINGQGDLSFRWFSSAINAYSYFSYSEDVTNLLPGDYFVTISDGCHTTQESYHVGYSNGACFDPNGNPVLSITNYHVQNIFPQDMFIGNKGDIYIDVNCIHTPFTSIWKKPLPGYVHDPISYEEDLLNVDAGNYSVDISDANNCSVHEEFEIKSCLNGLHFSLDFTHSSYCNYSGNAEILVKMLSGVPPYKLKLYLGDNVNKKLILLDEETISGNNGSLHGLTNTGVYYIYMEDAFGTCASRVQFIPCRCDAFDFDAWAKYPCGRPFLTFGKKKIGYHDIINNYDQWYQSPYFYEEHFFNYDQLEFIITWPDGHTGIAKKGHGIVSGQDHYDIPRDGKYTVTMTDPFGCKKTHTFTFGNETKCIALGTNGLMTLLNQFYMPGTNPYDLDNIPVQPGCYYCNYCGEKQVYCKDICGGGSVSGNNKFRALSAPNTNPCASLSFRCPQDDANLINTVPPGSFFTEFVNTSAKPVFIDGHCALPCGCLYPPYTWEDNPEPVWVETLVITPGLVCADPGNIPDRTDPNDPVENNDCTPCEVPDYQIPPGTCTLMYRCLDNGCTTEVVMPLQACDYFVVQTGECIYIEFCPKSHEILTLLYNQPCTFDDCPASIHPPIQHLNDHIEVRNGIITDTSSISLVDEFNIFPTPASTDLFYIINNELRGNYKIYISDLFGNTIITFKSIELDNGFRGYLNISNLPPATYIFSLVTDYDVKSKLFIKI
ncbi:MAG: T9SS type A sorting domain-containing protein [Saprospiraceae bacterium]